jgi:hypothetical protein
MQYIALLTDFRSTIRLIKLFTGSTNDLLDIEHGCSRGVGKCLRLQCTSGSYDQIPDLPSNLQSSDPRVYQTPIERRHKSLDSYNYLSIWTERNHLGVSLYRICKMQFLEAMFMMTT